MRAEEQLATTLVCAVIEPIGSRTSRAYLMGAGDSVAWLLSAGQFVEILAGKTLLASGIASSALVGLPRVPTEVMRAVVDVADDDVLLDFSRETFYVVPTLVAVWPRKHAPSRGPAQPRLPSAVDGLQ